jgi:ABC-2 type transport system ATP-binding protein
VIRVEHLTKRFAAITAVDDVSFEVEPREIVGFLGPNGAGKTTTLRVLTGYHPASAGKVLVDDHDVFRQPERVKRVIGYLPENVPLYPEMRVSEYLHYRAGLKRMPRSRRAKAVEAALERCRLGDVRRRIIGQLSKGYRQRVGLADALVADPKILILDEPTIGLDPNQIRQVRELIRELGRERTVILSSHILPEVEAVCSRVLIINRGKIVGQGRPDELRAGAGASRATITAEVRDPEGRAPGALAAVAGVREVAPPIAGDDGLLTFTIIADPDPNVRERIFDAAVDAGFKLLGLGSRTVSLEDIFVEITTSEDDAPVDGAPAESTPEPDDAGQGKPGDGALGEEVSE